MSMEPMTEQELARIDEAAKAATKGPWIAKTWGVCVGYGLRIDRPNRVFIDVQANVVGVPQDEMQGNRDYIATCSPDVAQRLVAEIRVYKRALEDAIGTLGDYSPEHLKSLPQIVKEEAEVFAADARKELQP